jgi:hypothetical protein
MNKAFVREPEFDGRALCPQCGALGTQVKKAALDHHIKSESRAPMGDSAWFCEFGRCDVAYFDLMERCILVSELQSPIYPKDLDAPICPCFGFSVEDIEADIGDGTPTRIRELLAKSESSDARCQTLAASGRCCMAEVQRLFMKGMTAS